MDMRTAQEVSEAFFSASNGNMDSINNILGEKYKNFGELIKGVNKKQADVLGDMSTTIPGLISTIKGKASASMKEFVRVFAEPLTNGFNNIIGFIDNLTPKLVDVANKVSSFFTGVRESGALTPIIEFMGNVFNTAFNMISVAVEASRPLIEKVFNFITANAPLLNNLIEATGAVWGAVWSTFGPLLSAAWSLVEPLLQGLADTLSGLLGIIRDVSNWWTNMVKSINDNPIVATVKKVFSGDDKVGKKNAFGSGRISKNGEVHMLHQGEKVLTKDQTNQLEKNGGLGGDIKINIANAIVREEADINKIAKAIARELRIAKASYVRG